MKVNFNQAAKFVRQAGKFVGIKLWKHSPTILAVLGSGSIITAGVMACKATLKLEETVEEKNDDILSVKASLENAQKEIETNGENAADAQEFIDKHYKKELAKSYLNMGLAVGKLYAPAVAVCAAGVGCIFGSKRIMDKRYSACLAACTTTERLFADYRKRVTEDLGKEADQKYRFGMETTEIDIPELDKKGNPKKDKDGNPKTKKQKITTIPANFSNMEYARVFDEVSTKEWDKNPDVNKNTLLLRQKYADDMLKSRGWLFLNEVYTMLGYPITDYGQDVGWIFEKDNPIGDNMVDFGLYKAFRPDSSETRMEMMCRENNAIVLDFNVDGYIKDRIYAAQNIFD